MRRDTFSTFHPAINFLFFIGAIALGMILLHPAFLAVSVLGSAAFYAVIRRRESLPFLGRMTALFLLLSMLNPLLNTNGERVLFTYFNRAYTLEALIYGMALAAMMISVLQWFACYNAVMTSDKFLYLFGRLIPSASLVLTMILRLVPEYQKKLSQINQAQKCIGRSADAGTKKEKAEHGLVLVSALTSWALEGGIVMADSMRSRGYGCGTRTAFSLYRFEGRDKLLLAVMAALIGAVVYCTAMGGAAAEYTPYFAVAGNKYTFVGAAAYLLFLLIPTAVNITEDIIWHILKSGI